MNYKQLAKQFFNEVKEETLDIDRKCLGAEDMREYYIDGVKFKIWVCGAWEKATWFDWKVFDESGNEIESGTEC